MPLTKSSPRIHYDRFGDSGPEVVLVMGLGMRGALWKPQTDELASDHQLVTLDHRGLGESPGPVPFPLTMRSQASDVLRLIDELGLQKPHLVGVSMGGMIAQELAVSAPHRIASLTLIATHPGAALSTIPPLRSLLALRNAILGTPAQRRSAFFDLLYTPEFIASSDPEVLLARAREQIGKGTDLKVFAAQLGAILLHDTGKRLEKLRCPVLLVRPDRDLLVRPVGLDRIAARIAHAELRRFPDAGHGITFQEAPALNALLRDFIRRAER